MTFASKCDCPRHGDESLIDLNWKSKEAFLKFNATSQITGTINSSKQALFKMGCLDGMEELHCGRVADEKGQIKDYALLIKPT